MLAALRSSARQKGGRQWARPVRLGLSTDEKQTLLLATNPGAESNPFSVGFYQARNRLIVCTLLELGLRAGELLNLRTIDINFQARTLRVVRRPDDPEDPRTRRPKVKTRGREIELNEMLLDRLFDFVTRWRRSLLHAGRHPFLFISDEGQPLSRDAVHLLFITLRRRVPGLPGNLSAHTLRHTWNDDFTELMDREKISPEKEVQIRSYLMGWSPTGTAAAAYTKRSTQRAAAEYGLRLQTPLHNAPG
jgi:integrase